jgi:hypothetical protein
MAALAKVSTCSLVFAWPWLRPCMLASYEAATVAMNRAFSL